MADGASPTLSLREAISLARQYFDDLMNGVHTERMLLEGVEINESTGNWVVTFGFDTSRSKPQRKLKSDYAGLQPLVSESLYPYQETEWIREFRAVHLSSGDGSFVKLEHA